MDDCRNEQFEIAWILPSPDHHELATCVFDETYYQTLPSASSHVIYTTGKIGDHRVVVASSSLVAVSQGANDIVDSLLHEFPAIRAGFLLSTNAETSQKGHRRVGDVVFGTKPDLQSGILYFDAGETKKCERLCINYQPEHIPETATSVCEAILSHKKAGKWPDYLSESYPHDHRIFRGTIASSVERVDDPNILDRIGSKDNILCFETTAASMGSQSFILVAGIARYADDRKDCLPSTEICKALVWYLSGLVRTISPIKLSIEPPLANYFRYESFDLDRPGFRLVRLEAESDHESIRCHLFEAYFDDKETLVPYEALSHCWGSITFPRHQVLVNGGFLFITENLFDGLKDLRQEDEDRILWIDALYIDQCNVRKRGHQVKWMSEVYKHAERVLFWLGHVPCYYRDLIMSLQSLKMEVPRNAWLDWTLDDQRWLDVWTRLQSQHLRRFDEVDLPSKLKSLMSKEWFSRVWILQEVANAQKALLGCSEGWVDAMAFAMAPRFLGVQPNAQCQAVIDIMPGPSRRNSWWSKKPNICTLLWRFRDSQAGDPRDRLYALLGLASDTEIEEGKIVADYTKTEDDVLRYVATYLFNSNIRDVGVKSISELQMRIPNLAAITLEKMVRSRCSVQDMDRFMQKQNHTVWISEAVVECTRPVLQGPFLHLGYFRGNPAFQQVVRGEIPPAGSPEGLTTLDRYLKPKNKPVEHKPNPAMNPPEESIEALVATGKPGPLKRTIIWATSVLVIYVYYVICLVAQTRRGLHWSSRGFQTSKKRLEALVPKEKAGPAKRVIAICHFPCFVARTIRDYFWGKQVVKPWKEARVRRDKAELVEKAMDFAASAFVIGYSVYYFLFLVAKMMRNQLWGKLVAEFRVYHQVRSQDQQQETA